MKAKWLFFVTSHGNNACGGVGGTIKILAARASLQRAVQNQILNPYQLYDFAKSEIHGITYFVVGKHHVGDISKILPPRFEIC